jgi:hypothetical protein
MLPRSALVQFVDSPVIVRTPVVHCFQHVLLDQVHTFSFTLCCSFRIDRLSARFFNLVINYGLHLSGFTHYLFFFSMLLID